MDRQKAAAVVVVVAVAESNSLEPSAHALDAFHDYDPLPSAGGVVGDLVRDVAAAATENEHPEYECHNQFMNLCSFI